MNLKIITDRKWYLLSLACFWALFFIVKREIFLSTGVMVFSFIALICSFLFVFLIQQSYEKNFVLLALLIGVFFICIAPFPCIIDEDFHFARSFALSNGQLFGTMENGTVQLSVPAGFTQQAVSQRWTLTNVWENPDLWFAPVSRVEFLGRVRSASYLPVDYLFSAIGILLARILNLPFLFYVILGRLFNYAAFVIVCYFAIRKAEHYKSLFFLVAVIPCALYGASTVSIDASLISSSLLFVSVCMNYCLEKKDSVSTEDFLLLLFASVFLLSGKYMGYFLILPLVFFMKKPLKRYKALLLSLLGVTLLIAFWQVCMLLKFRGSIDSGAAFDNVSLQGQFAWAMNNKGQFLQLICRDFIENLPKRIYGCSYSEEPVFTFLSLPLRFLPFVAAARAKDKVSMEIRESRPLLAYWLLAAAVMMLICNISVYFAWNPVGNQEILGIHERYSMPYMIFVLFAFSQIQTVNRMKQHDICIVFLSGLAVLNMSMGTLLHCV